MTGPYLVERAQAEDLAARHGLVLESPAETAPVYGRWASESVVVSVVHHERGWWCGVRALRPQGGSSWWLRTDYRPRLATVERLILAAQEDFRAERPRAA